MKDVLFYIILITISYNSLGQSPFTKGELDDWNNIKKQFETVKDPLEYCEITSDHKLTIDTLYSSFGGEIMYLNLQIADSVRSKKEKSIVGPFRSTANGAPQSVDFIFKILKIDSCYKIKASHILLKDKNEKDITKDHKLANKILDDLANGGSFEKAASKYGTDATAKNGGDLGWFEEGMMVKSFNDACFQKQKGDFFKVETQFGVHIVMIKEDKIKVPSNYIILPIIKYSSNK